METQEKMIRVSCVNKQSIACTNACFTCHKVASEALLPERSMCLTLGPREKLGKEPLPALEKTVQAASRRHLLDMFWSEAEI